MGLVDLVERAKVMLGHCVAMADECPSCLEPNTPKHGHRHNCEIGQWLADASATNAKVMRVSVFKNEYDLYQWRCVLNEEEQIGIEPLVSFAKRKEAIANATRVASELGMGIEVEE